MPKLIQLAKYLVYSYENYTAARFGDNELKLQAMLYFAQRECLAMVGEPLFEESFEGWEEGPVLAELHFFFEEGYDPFEPLEMKKLTEREQFILDRIVLTTGSTKAGILRIWRAAKHPGAKADLASQQKQLNPNFWNLRISARMQKKCGCMTRCLMFIWMSWRISKGRCWDHERNTSLHRSHREDPFCLS